MDLQPYVDAIHRQLLTTAEAGDQEARALAQRLIAPLDATIQLTLQSALAAAAEEITCELAPGSVELRLRGGSPEFVVVAPPPPSEPDRGPPVSVSPEGDDGAMARINLRMPDLLKARVEQAAATEGFSVNAWLVRAATTALHRGDSDRRHESPSPRSPQRYTGWNR